MSVEIPFNRTIPLTYNWASLLTSHVSRMVVNRSTITQRAFFFKAKRGNPMRKSIEILSHFRVGISRDLSSPTGHWCSAWNIIPFPCGYFQGSQFTYRSLMLSLNLLAYEAPIYILHNLLLHIIPPKVLSQVSIHVGSPWVYWVPGVMSFFQDLFP